jgi:hypothetical protein
LRSSSTNVRDVALQPAKVLGTPGTGAGVAALLYANNGAFSIKILPPATLVLSLGAGVPANGRGL